MKNKRFIPRTSPDIFTDFVFSAERTGNGSYQITNEIPYNNRLLLCVFYYAEGRELVLTALGYRRKLDKKVEVLGDKIQKKSSGLLGKLKDYFFGESFEIKPIPLDERKEISLMLLSKLKDSGFSLEEITFSPENTIFINTK